MSESSIADLVIDGLRRSDIDTLFCLPGVQNDDFFNALVDARDITPIVTRHEQGAAYMAMGAAQVTGRPAAFCVVPGPGALNATAGLTSAYWGYARVLAIIGQIATTMQGRDIGTLHDLNDQTAILRQVTKEAIAIGDPADGAALVQRAIDSLHSGVPRPVSLEVPVDVWAETGRRDHRGADHHRPQPGRRRHRAGRQAAHRGPSTADHRRLRGL